MRKDLMLRWFHDDGKMDVSVMWLSLLIAPQGRTIYVRELFPAFFLKKICNFLAQRNPEDWFRVGKDPIQCWH